MLHLIFGLSWFWQSCLVSFISSAHSFWLLKRSFHFLNETRTVRYLGFIQIINCRFVCADTPDKYSSRVMECNPFLFINFAVSLHDVPDAAGRCSSSSKLCHWAVNPLCVRNFKQTAETFGDQARINLPFGHCRCCCSVECKECTTSMWLVTLELVRSLWHGNSSLIFCWWFAKISACKNFPTILRIRQLAKS